MQEKSSILSRILNLFMVWQNAPKNLLCGVGPVYRAVSVGFPQTPCRVREACRGHSSYTSAAGIFLCRICKNYWAAAKKYVELLIETDKKRAIQTAFGMVLVLPVGVCAVGAD
jgi:hypothetical protein